MNSKAGAHGHDAGRVQQYELVVWLRQDAQYPMPCRLRLGRDDGELLAQQRVEQRALARIGPPNDSHIACPHSPLTNLLAVHKLNKVLARRTARCSRTQQHLTCAQAGRSLQRRCSHSRSSLSHRPPALHPGPAPLPPLHLLPQCTPVAARACPSLAPRPPRGACLLRAAPRWLVAAPAACLGRRGGPGARRLCGRYS